MNEIFVEVVLSYWWSWVLENVWLSHIICSDLVPSIICRAPHTDIDFEKIGDHRKYVIRVFPLALVGVILTFFEKFFFVSAARKSHQLQKFKQYLLEDDEIGTKT